MAEAAERIGVWTEFPWPAELIPGRAEDLSASTEPPVSAAPHKEPNVAVASPADPVERRTMIVGRATCVSGEICFCDRLVVEGNIEASLHECRELNIAAGGAFKGNASTDNAEINGRFVGDLVVRKRLVIGASGQVFGTVTYREIEIVGGAMVSGILMHEPSAVLSW